MNFDGDCSHEIKRSLLLGRKTMTNVNSILRSRDNTLLTKVHLVKAMVFLVVMDGCESWTIKKAECRRTDVFDISLGYLDSSLCFFQSSVSHDVLCIEVK